MAIITIARECCSHGAEIAEKTAAMLGYECISREVLLEAAYFFNIPEQKLLHSIHDAPSVLERLTHGREKYLAYIRAALLEHVKKDNIVYHGYAGHLLIPEVTHVLKVRLFASESDRIALLQKEQKMSQEDALAFLKSEDRQRIDWTRYIYNRDIHDLELYDLIINLTHMRIQDACDIICQAARSDIYATTPASQKLASAAMSKPPCRTFAMLRSAPTTGWFIFESPGRKSEKLAAYLPTCSSRSARRCART